MEIRTKVSDYVHKRIEALRIQSPGDYQNIAVLRANAMKFIPNFFESGQLTKIFFLFPDPHLHIWMVEKLDAHPLFERILNEELAEDPVVKCVLEKTEEGIKVARNNGDKYLAVYKRLE